MIVSVSCSFCLSSVWRWKLPAESYRNGESYPMLICQMNKLLTFAIQSLTPAGYLWANDIVAHILYHSLSFHSVGENTVTIPNPLFLLKNNLTTEGIFWPRRSEKQGYLRMIWDICCLLIWWMVRCCWSSIVFLNNKRWLGDCLLEAYDDFQMPGGLSLAPSAPSTQ